MYGLWIIIAIIVLIALWYIGTYNKLVGAKNATDNSWADIDVQLKRRYDLIPNLVETVKGYASHEKNLFENVTKARTAAMAATTPAAHAAAENMLSGTLKSLFAVAENYPDLKASQNFLGLQSELADAEDKIQAARRFYNANVRDFNTMLQTFPTNVVAGFMGFKSREFFEVADGAQREAPKVSF
jgi:LemA protein